MDWNDQFCLNRKIRWLTHYCPTFKSNVQSDQKVKVIKFDKKLVGGHAPFVRYVFVASTSNKTCFFQATFIQFHEIKRQKTIKLQQTNNNLHFTLEKQLNNNNDEMPFLQHPLRFKKILCN